RLEHADPLDPARVGRARAADFVDQSRRLTYLLLVLLGPVREGLVARSDLCGERPVEVGRLELLVPLELGREPSPQATALLGARLLDLLDLGLRLLVLLLQELDRIHAMASLEGLPPRPARPAASRWRCSILRPA